MKHTFRLTRLSLLPLLLLTLAAHGRAQSPATSGAHPAVAAACEEAAGRPGLEPSACALTGTSRRHIARDIFEYSYALKVGAGAHDSIRVHRVVRELSPNVPRRSERAALLVHGDIWNFDAAFLGSTLSGNVPREQSVGK